MSLSSHILHYLFLLQAFFSYTCEYQWWTFHQVLFCESTSYQDLFLRIKLNSFPRRFFPSCSSMLHSQNHLKMYVSYIVDFLTALGFLLSDFAISCLIWAALMSSTRAKYLVSTDGSYVILLNFVTLGTLFIKSSIYNYQCQAKISKSKNPNFLIFLFLDTKKSIYIFLHTTYNPHYKCFVII